MAIIKNETNRLDITIILIVNTWSDKDAPTIPGSPGGPTGPALPKSPFGPFREGQPGETGGLVLGFSAINMI